MHITAANSSNHAEYDKIYDKMASFFISGINRTVIKLTENNRICHGASRDLSSTSVLFVTLLFYFAYVAVDDKQLILFSFVLNVTYNRKIKILHISAH